MAALPPKRRSELRAEAHKLSPVVIIGDKGLTDEVVAEIDRSLKAHELIKVRANTAVREDRDTWLEAICERLGAHAVQQIGKIFVIYREDPEKRAAGGSRQRAEPQAPPRAAPKSKAKKAAARRPPPAAEPATRTARPRSRTPAPRPASGPRRRPRSTSR